MRMVSFFIEKVVTWLNEIFLLLAYRALDAQLDQLNSALDALEQKTDQIHEKAKDLLKSNRELRNGAEPEAMDQEKPNSDPQ